MSAKTTNQPASHNDKGTSASNSPSNKNKSEQQQSNVPKEQQTAVLEENSTTLQNKQAPSKIPKKQEQSSSLGHTKSPKSQNDKTQQMSEKQHQRTENGMSNNLKTAENQQDQTTKDNKQSANADIKKTEKDSGLSAIAQDNQEMNEKDNNKNDAKDKDKPEKKSEKDKQKQENDKKEQESKQDKEIILESNFYNEVKQKEQSFIDMKAIRKTEVKHIAKDKKETHESTAMDGIVVGNVIPESRKGDNINSIPTSSKTTVTPPKKTQAKQDVTTCIDDYERESLKVKSPPSKQEISVKNTSYSTSEYTNYQDSVEKTKVETTFQPPSVTAENPFSFSTISGRRAIHPIIGYTQSKFQSNFQLNEPYRRTEMDITNTSKNATVGSDMPNNATFRRGRKRELIQGQHLQSAMGHLQNKEIHISSSKRQRMGFFSVVSSPLSVLRNRLFKSSQQSNTPVKVQQIFDENEDDDEVLNVSSESLLEDIEKIDSEQKESSLGADTTSSGETQNDGKSEVRDEKDKDFPMKTSCKAMSDGNDIKMIESELHDMSGYSSKNKRCAVM